MSGYLPHRRREDTIAVQKIMGWRLRREGTSFISCLYDASNAFGSSVQEELELAAEDMFLERDLPFVRQRIYNAFFTVETPEEVAGEGVRGGRWAPLESPKPFK